ncbi:MAG TPA: cofactor-independent phosphoglycerate mutase [Syntrophomonadaceae bacterium]|nr:cofactor-independent phosphoglycerate mutase [Syntrophomonadaceae bacterium]
MKYLLILSDGMSDYPIAELDNCTPLEYAHTPFMDNLAKKSTIGNVQTIPAGFPPGSDVANLSVMGYDPTKYYTGRSPLEALSMGVELADNELAVRCNLVTLSDEENYQDKTMLDYSAGEISTEESSLLINRLRNELGNILLTFYAGISYRHLVVWNNENDNDLVLTPPHDISDRLIKEYLPKGADSWMFLELMVASEKILKNHPINIKRINEGKNPANSIWLWGEGRRPSLPQFRYKYGLSGSVVAAVDLVKGIGISAGLKPVSVEGGTGGIETNFSGKAQAALDELKNGQDFVYLHIESPDEAGHQGNLEKKIWAIEQVDKEVVGLVTSQLDEFEDLRILLLPDHPTPLSLKTHTSDPVPFMLFDKNNIVDNELGDYNEKSGAKGVFIDSGYKLMDMFIGK